QLSGGGGAVARSLGGERVTRATADPLRRRLLNVVEEMAIASGTPVPEVYVLEQEPGINAFAAGLSTSGAAIAVTRGALERLTRSELQGVIGHEFSHILNGDMRLNTRLAGPLFGLLIIATAARHVLRHFRGGGNRKGGGLLIAVFAVMALGYIGVLLGRLLQSAISRQREFLADASSAQFTRQPAALRDALVRIARSGRASKLDSADGEDLAHLFFLPAYSRMFATHPPIAERVKALDPRYPLPELQKLEKLDAGTMELAGEDALTSESGIEVASLAAGGGPVRMAPGQVVESVGQPGLDEVAYARVLRESLPEDLEAALSRGTTAACLWLALLTSREQDMRTRQLAEIAEALGDAVASQVRRFVPAAHALPVVQRLPLVQRALPVLSVLPADRRRIIAMLTHSLSATDGQVDVFEFMLGHLAAQYLAEQLVPPTQQRLVALDDLHDELGLLFATLAAAGHDGATEARRAYERGLAHVLPRTRPEFAVRSGSNWHRALNEALQRLDRLAPAGKELLVDGLARTVTHDDIVQVAEAELLRAICAALHCPLPPLLSRGA
ncbi:MAG: M48 family metallopeptidase, partial [Gammaproteobacteria bacterium]|nr:M48 family metallopeptidase [Gammaproteobacteria bacterium]